MDTLLFSSIISGLAKAKHENRSAECIRLFESMPNAKELMNSTVFYNMLSCYPPERTISFWSEVARDRPELFQSVFEKDPYFYNILILSMLKEEKIAEAWAIFQFLTRQKQANSETYYPIVKYLCKRASTPSAYNSCREILNSSYFQLIKIDQLPFWRSIFQHLIDENDYTNLVSTIELFKSCTTNHLSPHFAQLYPYLSSKDPKTADYLLNK
ncbi:hypothetical protein PPL_05980 [Heterostelium album PN500]|uniref:Pentatricopeptide repeat-containing protein n=1 Tax=Heterostelium pallidum (strain ATCC 26659 / Pp 5 / PN500) TaxID=670386 RepID=D3BBW0_HETP5|nr:hypothetical protein PPL_05980 [Heterostelium album PN500]EFA81143.1 hypothetical protein PPL_05980 [Heterostelium album PN500]|eukprot:XP_020433261.1 hypothetical protein PPL_05980 [Heterostelium album PN500]